MTILGPLHRAPHDHRRRHGRRIQPGGRSYLLWWIAALLALALVLTLAACSSLAGGPDTQGVDSAAAEQAAGSDSATAPPTAEDLAGTPSDGAGRAGTGRDANRAAAGLDGGLDGSLSGSLGLPRQVIVTVDLQMRVEDAAAAVDQARTAAVAAGGFVAEEALVTDPLPGPTPVPGRPADQPASDTEPTSGTVVLRVPVDRVDAVIEQLTGLGTVLSRTGSSVDVTEEVVDLDARIETQRASLSRLRQLLTEADRLADVIAVESELTQRQADLESLLARRQQLAGLSSLATVSARFVTPAVAPEPASSSGFTAGLQRGWQALLTAGTAAVTLLGLALPFLLAGVLLALPLWLLLFRGRRDASPGRGAAASVTAERAGSVAGAPGVDVVDDARKDVGVG
jgi:uncharacterized RDD family membrane protein YckC